MAAVRMGETVDKSDTYDFMKDLEGEPVPTSFANLFCSY